MGVVYRAQHLETGREVALKTVSAPTSELRESLRREVSLLAETNHPGVVGIVAFDLEGAEPWYAMDLLRGAPLAAWNRELWRGHEDPCTLNMGGPESARSVAPIANGRLGDVLELFLKICDPIGYLHQNGIIHCDLKPANILIEDGQSPVLVDFGLVTTYRGAIERESLMVSGRCRGTLPYLSPEVIQGKIPDARADVYALGCMLYESLAGRPPFVDWSSRELLRLHVETEAPPLSTFVTGVPGDIQDLVALLLAKAPGRRLSHVEELAAALAKFIGGSPRTEALRSNRILRSPMVGREDALVFADEQLRGLELSRGASLVVAGESGIGKTFFASELSQRALLTGHRVVIGECLPADRPGGAAGGGAFHALRRLFEVARDIDGERAACGGPTVFATELDWLTPYSARIANDGAAASPLALLPDAAARERVVEAVVRVIVKLSALRPLMVVLDDVQWVDDLSLSALRRLMAEAIQDAPIVLLLTCRSEEMTPSVRLLWDAADGRVELGRLDRAEIAVMAQHMTGRQSLPVGFLDFLYAESEGVPFFVAEYLRQTLTERAGLPSADVWGPAPSQLTVANRPSFPSRLRALVRTRLGSVSEVTRHALRQASVLGREFDLRVIAGALGESDNDARELLEEALTRDLLQPAVPGTYRFSHDKFRETLYDDLEAPARAELHRHAARALEEVSEDRRDLAFHFGQIGRHHREAGDRPRATHYLARAGERSLAVAADADALAYLTEALALEAELTLRLPGAERAGWHRGVADACLGLGRMNDSVEALGHAARALGSSVPVTAHQTGYRLSLELAKRAVPNALRRSPEGDVPRRRELARVMERLIRSSYYRGDSNMFLFACLSALTHAEASGPSLELTCAHIFTSAVASVLPIHRVARAYMSTAEKALRDEPEPSTETQLLLFQAAYELGLGNAAVARKYVEKGLEIATRIGFYRRRDEFRCVGVGLDLFAGRTDRVFERCQEVETDSRTRGDDQMLAWAFAQRIDCMLLHADYTGAQEEYARVEPHLARAGRPEDLWATGLAAYAMYRAGSLERALERGRHALALARAGRPVHTYCLHAYSRLTELWLSIAGDNRFRNSVRKEALDYARVTSGISRAAARVFPVAAPDALLHAGAVLAANGKHAAAHRTWRAGLAAARERDMPYSEARLLDALLGDGAADAPRVRQIADALAVPMRTIALPAITRPSTYRRSWQ